MNEKMKYIESLEMQTEQQLENEDTNQQNLLDYEGHMLHYHRLDDVYLTRNVCIAITFFLGVFMISLKKLCETDDFPAIFNYNFFLMNLCVCGVFGMVLGVLKCIALFWWNFGGEGLLESKYFRTYTKFISIFFIVFSLYAVSIANYHFVMDVLCVHLPKLYIKSSERN